MTENQNQTIVNDALRITKFLNQHSEDFCPDCKELISQIFESENTKVVGPGEATTTTGLGATIKGLIQNGYSK